MNKLILLAGLALAAAPPALARKLRSYGSRTEQVFCKTPVHFRPGSYSGTAPDSAGVVHLVDGRIVLKKISVPRYEKDLNILLDVSLRSAGDRWDKSGSLFVIPQESAITLLGLADGSQQLPAVDSVRYEALRGIVAGEGYVPVLELLRFMTPFGVGYYSNDTLGRKPVFVDGWADSVRWSQNLTHLRSRLEGDVWVGAYIDSWTPEGYELDVRLTFDELGYSEALQPKTRVTPILNTVPYMQMGMPDIFARRELEVPFSIPKGAKKVRLVYTVTGHGGHSGGDEFKPCRNILKVDGNVVHDFLPWRTDCATFRRLNPSTYVWRIDREETYVDPQTKERKTRTVNEPLGSSDLSRSNWCPGSDVVPETIALGDIAPGEHVLSISIPEATAADGDRLNHWLVSSYLIWEE